MEALTESNKKTLDQEDKDYNNWINLSNINSALNVAIGCVENITPKDKYSFNQIEDLTSLLIAIKALTEKSIKETKQLAH